MGKNKVITFLAVLVSGLILGCSKQTNVSPPAPVPEPPEKIEENFDKVTFVQKLEDLEYFDMEKFESQLDETEKNQKVKDIKLRLAQEFYYEAMAQEKALRQGVQAGELSLLNAKQVNEDLRRYLGDFTAINGALVNVFLNLQKKAELATVGDEERVFNPKLESCGRLFNAVGYLFMHAEQVLSHLYWKNGKVGEKESLRFQGEDELDQFLSLGLYWGDDETKLKHQLLVAKANLDTVDWLLKSLYILIAGSAEAGGNEFGGQNSCFPSHKEEWVQKLIKAHFSILQAQSFYFGMDGIQDRIETQLDFAPLHIREVNVAVAQYVTFEVALAVGTGFFGRIVSTLGNGAARIFGLAFFPISRSSFTGMASWLGGTFVGKTASKISGWFAPTTLMGKVAKGLKRTTAFGSYSVISYWMMEHLLKEQFNDDDKEKYVEDPGAQPITHNSVNGGLVFQGIPLVVLKGQAYEMTQSVDDRSITTKNWWNVLDLVDAYKESGFYSINIMLGVLESRYKAENDFDLMRMKYLRDKFGDSFFKSKQKYGDFDGAIEYFKTQSGN